MSSLSLEQARRIVLAAQGFSGRSGRPSSKAGVRRMVERLGAVQIDSVNVLARAHYLPAFSRLGPYDREHLHRLAYRDRALFEYWGHEASFLPVDLHPLLRWRMARARAQYETWGGIARVAKERPAYVEHVRELVRERGPLTAGEIAAEDKRAKEHWGWNWSDEKRALEFLFWSGEVTAYDRRGFERRYDLTERVLPPAVLGAPTPTESEAHRALLLRAAGALGVASVADLADYFRLKVPQARPRLAELVAEGELEEVAVEGWRVPAYVLPATVVPRRRTGVSALVSPFDSLVWERDRTERLFGFRYRIEIYLPADKRVHGYYVLPFLHDGALVGRVDLKADRQARVLRVQAAYAEPSVDVPEVATALAGELHLVAQWLGLGAIDVVGRGDLAPALHASVGRLAVL